MDWLPRHAAAASVIEQAACIARQLGHRLAATAPWNRWPPHSTPDTAIYWSVVCERCFEHGIVRPRSWHGPPMSGVVLTFHCKG